MPRAIPDKARTSVKTLTPGFLAFFGHKTVSAVLLLSLVSNLLLLVPTVYMLQVFDRVLVSMNTLTLVFVSLLCLYLFLILAVTDWARLKLLGRVALQLEQTYATRAAWQSFALGESQMKAALLSPLEKVRELKRFISSPTATTLLDLPFIPIYLVALYLLHPLLLALAFGLILVQSAFARFSFTSTSPLFETSVQASRNEDQFLQTSLRHADVVTAMGMSDNLRAGWWAHRVAANRAATRSQTVANAFANGSKGLRYLQQGLSLALGAILVIKGEITAGAMIAANVLASRALAPIDSLVTSWKSLLSAFHAWSSVRQLPAEPARIRAELAWVEPELTLSNNARLRVSKGLIWLVLGPTGAGKSTFLESMVGLRETPSKWGRWQLHGSSGLVFADGLWGSGLGYLGQSLDILPTSVARNISRLMNPETDHVIKVTSALGLHTDLLLLPQGYDTVVNESISMGLCQRIALARALYKSPPLIVLDEPFAALDSASQQALQKVLLECKAQGCTVVLAGHGPALLELADNLVLVRELEIVAYGPKDQLSKALLNQSPN
jgi:ATP-binding cassette subfamily C exporter for protease/lipase